MILMYLLSVDMCNVFGRGVDVGVKVFSFCGLFVVVRVFVTGMSGNSVRMCMLFLFHDSLKFKGVSFLFPLCCFLVVGKSCGCNFVCKLCSTCNLLFSLVGESPILTSFGLLAIFS